VPVLVLVVVPAGHHNKIDPGPLREQPGQFHVLQVGHIETGLAKLK
jgi:hypothetical protein